MPFWSKYAFVMVYTGVGGVGGRVGEREGEGEGDDSHIKVTAVIKNTLIFNRGTPKTVKTILGGLNLI